MTVADPAVTAWSAAGRPLPDVLCDVPGTCARCRSSERMCAPTGLVVSAKYGDWDRLRPGAGTPLLCVACAWAHRDPGLRTTPVLVGGDAFRCLDRSGLADALGAPVGPDTALTVPDGRRKHLLPGASWGMVTTDLGSVRWSAADAALVAVLRRVLDAGIPAAGLSDADPPVRAFARVTGEDLPGLLADWSSLGPWRSEPTKMHIGFAVARRVTA